MQILGDTRISCQRSLRLKAGKKVLNQTDGSDIPKQEDVDRAEMHPKSTSIHNRKE